MRKVLMTVAAVAVLGFSGPALAELTEEYMAACMQVTQNNETLCTCKTEQAAQLDDEEMLSYLVVQMRSPFQFNAAIAEGRVPEEIMQRWPFYVRDTSRACSPS